MVRIWWLMEGSAVFRESGLVERVGLDGNDLYREGRNIRGHRTST